MNYNEFISSVGEKVVLHLNNNKFCFGQIIRNDLYNLPEVYWEDDVLSGPITEDAFVFWTTALYFI